MVKVLLPVCCVRICHPCQDHSSVSGSFICVRIIHLCQNLSYVEGLSSESGSVNYFLSLPIYIKNISTDIQYHSLHSFYLHYYFQNIICNFKVLYTVRKYMMKVNKWNIFTKIDIYKNRKKLLTGIVPINNSLLTRTVCEKWQNQLEYGLVNN